MGGPGDSSPRAGSFVRFAHHVGDVNDGARRDGIQIVHASSIAREKIKRSAAFTGNEKPIFAACVDIPICTSTWESLVGAAVERQKYIEFARRSIDPEREWSLLRRRKAIGDDRNRGRDPWHDSRIESRKQDRDFHVTHFR
jgi:hypothetical protein